MNIFDDRLCQRDADKAARKCAKRAGFTIENSQRVYDEVITYTCTNGELIHVEQFGGKIKAYLANSDEPTPKKAEAAERRPDAEFRYGVGPIKNLPGYVTSSGIVVYRVKR